MIKFWVYLCMDHVSRVVFVLHELYAHAIRTQPRNVHRPAAENEKQSNARRFYLCPATNQQRKENERRKIPSAL